MEEVQTKECGRGVNLTAIFSGLLSEASYFRQSYPVETNPRASSALWNLAVLLRQAEAASTNFNATFLNNLGECSP